MGVFPVFSMHFPYNSAANHQQFFSYIDQHYIFVSKLKPWTFTWFSHVLHRSLAHVSEFTCISRSLAVILWASLDLQKAQRDYHQHIHLTSHLKEKKEQNKSQLIHTCCWSAPSYLLFVLTNNKKENRYGQGIKSIKNQFQARITESILAMMIVPFAKTGAVREWF